MADKVDYLDCCSGPELETRAGIYQSHHDAEALRQCLTCGSYWFYRFHEYVTYASDDDWTVWYTRLTDEEARQLMEDPEGADRSMLTRRPSFMKDAGGVRRVDGQPADPWA